jgi:hypothetical protein
MREGRVAWNMAVEETQPGSEMSSTGVVSQAHKTFPFLKISQGKSYTSTT